MNGFSEFAQDCELIDDGTCKLADLDRIFIATNVALPGMRSDDNPDRALMRFEFLEAVCRVAIAKYKESGSGLTESESIEKLISTLIEPNARKEIDEIDPNVFRNEKLYFEDVCKVIRGSLTELHSVFKQYSGKYSKPGDKKMFQSIDEWMALVTTQKLLDIEFTEREARLVFVRSNMTVVDEHKRDAKSKAKDAHNMSTFTEFLECMCRATDKMCLGGVSRSVDDRKLSERLPFFLERLFAEYTDAPPERGEDGEIIETSRSGATTARDTPRDTPREDGDKSKLTKRGSKKKLRRGDSSRRGDLTSARGTPRE
jgi:hypothetical protein